MSFTFTLMSKADVQSIQTWHYEEPYAVYNTTADLEEEALEMLDRKSPHYAVRDETGELVGFFCFGTAAQPWSHDNPGLYGEDRILDIGLGMRPDLTGKGLGLTFVRTGLAFAREQFAPAAFRLFVLTFNKRAIRVYKRAGFKTIGALVQRSAEGERTFLRMRLEA